jgi:hypothetical protein
MNPALLNAIYHKIDSKKQFESLQDVVNYYEEKVFELYIGALSKVGIDNLDQKIKVTTKFPDGNTLTSVFKAGHHMIEVVLDSEEYRKEINELDTIFLKNCQCENKEDILDKLKYILMEVGSETIDKHEWSESVQGFSNCEDFQHIIDF